MFCPFENLKTKPPFQTDKLTKRSRNGDMFLNLDFFVGPTTKNEHKNDDVTQTNNQNEHKMMTEKKNKKKTLKRVEIPSGTWKYVLIQLGDDSYLVRGRRRAYHADVFFLLRIHTQISSTSIELFILQAARPNIGSSRINGYRLQCSWWR